MRLAKARSIYFPGWYFEASVTTLVKAAPQINKIEKVLSKVSFRQSFSKGAINSH